MENYCNLSFALIHSKHIHALNQLGVQLSGCHRPAGSQEGVWKSGDDAGIVQKTGVTADLVGSCICQGHWRQRRIKL